MNTPKLAAVAAIALSCLTSVQPAFAEASREEVSVRVRHAGLNLSNPAHRVMFDARVARASRHACREQGAPLAMRSSADRCMAEMRSDAARQVALLVQRRGVDLAAR